MLYTCVRVAFYQNVFILTTRTWVITPNFSLGHGTDRNVTKIMASGPITSWQIDGQKMETVTDFIFFGSESLWMLIAAMKLKDACSLGEKLLPT